MIVSRLQNRSRWLVRVPAVVCALLVASVLASCGGGLNPFANNALYVPDLVAKAQDYNGKDVTVDGAYLGRDGRSVLALGVSTLDNGLDAQPLGEQIWLEGFPSDTAQQLHQPGDAVYGFVRVNGRFETGDGFGPDKNLKNRITVTSVEPIERVTRQEVRIPRESLGEGKVSFYDLMADPAKFNGQTITTRGYYFWNGLKFVLSEGISTEEDGSSPQPIGNMIWMEGFPPDVSGQLHLGPNNSYVWGPVEVTGAFQSGGSFGKDGAYPQFLQATSARALEQSK